MGTSTDDKAGNTEVEIKLLDAPESTKAYKQALPT